MQKFPHEPSFPSTSSVFSSTDGLGYPLQSNHRAAARLNLQQYLWRETLGYLIHPAVQIPNFNPVIADVALPQILTGFVFENARVSYYDEPPELVRAFSDQRLMTVEKFAGKLIQMGQVESGRHFYELVRRGYEESVHGACLSLPRLVVVARKPLSSSNFEGRSNRRPFGSL